MLGLDNPIHILFLLGLLLLVFGAKRLPEIGRSMGAGLRGFKESITGEPYTPIEQATVTNATETPAAEPDAEPAPTRRAA